MRATGIWVTGMRAMQTRTAGIRRSHKRRYQNRRTAEDGRPAATASMPSPHNPGLSFGPQPFHAGDHLWIGDDVGVSPPATPHFFRVQGPHGYQGLGWSSQFGPERSYTHYRDQSGSGFGLWRIGNLVVIE